MKEIDYINCISLLSKTKRRHQITLIVCKSTPQIIVISYILLILSLIIMKSNHLTKILLVPSITLIFITIIRKVINKKRPFEEYNYTPLIGHSKGYSFPSRHSSSALIIAYAFLYLNHPLTILIFLITIIVIITRVLSGVHRPSDVLAAIIITSIFAYFGFYLF